MRKLCTSSVKSSSTLFIVEYVQFIIDLIILKKQRLTLKSYIPGINPLIYPKRHDENLFSEKLVNKWHDWMDKQPHLIKPPNVSD